MTQGGPLELGARVRARRKAAGLSLDGLARASSVSKAMLSQIEQNKANPTLAVIYKIAAALRVDLSELIDAAGLRHHFQVVRADDDRQLFTASQRCTVRTLSPLWLEKDIEFYQVDLPAGGQIESEPHFRNTDELITVSRGRVQVVSADRQVLLRAGDSAYYSADVRHAIRNPGRSPARAYLVVKYRTD